MNQPSSFKTIHAIGVAFAAAMVAVFFWSTLGAAAFNGPTQNPSAGNGAIYSDSSNNVYIGGNLNVTGTITGSGLGGSTINAANVSSGEFGSSTGGGNYSFSGILSVGGLPNAWSGDQIEIIPNGDGNSGMEFDYTNTAHGYGNFDFNIGGAYLWSFGAAAPNYTDDPNIANNFYITNDEEEAEDPGGPAGYPLIISETSSYVGIQEPNPANVLDVDGAGDFRGNLAVGTTTTSTATLNVIGTGNFSSNLNAYAGVKTSAVSIENSGVTIATVGTNANNDLSLTGGVTQVSAGLSVGFGTAYNIYPPTNGLMVLGNTILGASSTPANLLDVDGAGDFRGNLAVGTTTTSTAMLNVNGSSSAAAYCISGANCITTWPSGSSGANPTGQVGTSAVNGSATTFMRSDGAPAINQAATFSFSALGNTTSTANITAASLNLTGGATTVSTISTSGILGKCASSSVTISGAVTSTGAVMVAPVTYPGVGLWWDGYVSAPGTVVIMECAATTTTVTASKFNAIYIY